jgi:hypothetical protein
LSTHKETPKNTGSRSFPKGNRAFPEDFTLVIGPSLPYNDIRSIFRGIYEADPDY